MYYNDSEDWDSKISQFTLPPKPAGLVVTKSHDGPPRNIESYRRWATTQKPKIWQLSPNGITPGMLIPVYYAVDATKVTDLEKCGRKNVITVFGRVQMR